MTEQLPHHQTSTGRENIQIAGSQNTITVYQAPQADDSRDREPFLDKLQRRYHDLLQQSLRQVEPIPLAMQDEPTATGKIGNSSEFTQKKETLSATTSLQNAFEQAGGELLLLGNPGAGKTTLLFTFAMDLYEQARNDPSCRLPVIINLATWVNKQPPLHEWLVQETARLYNNFPRSPIKKWLQSGSLLLLLDGLDEVPASVRGACIEAINTFRGQHSEHFQPMIVCCRHQEYFVQKERLIFQNAIKVQPLQEQQVKHYLTDVGKPLEGIRKLLRNDAELRQIVETPLMLHILTLAYQGVSVRTLPKKGSPEEQKHYIFDQYIHRMLREHPELPSLSDAQVQQWKRWLAYIAQQMRDHNQETFLVEDIVSDWLPNRYRLLYPCCIGLLSGLAFGLLSGLFFGLFNGLFIGLAYGLVLGLFNGLFIGLAYWLDSKLLNGLGSKLLSGKGNDKNSLLVEAFTWSWRKAFIGLFLGLLFGLILGLFGGLLGRLLGRLLNGLLFGLFFGLFGRLLSPLSSGLSSLPLSPLSSGLSGGLFLGLLFGLILGLFLGLSSQHRIEQPLAPNKGIWRSAKNGLFIGLGIGLVSGLVSGLLNGLFGGLLFGLLFGLLAGLFFGLNAFLQHFTLRFLLRRLNYIPWDIVAFLNQASHRILLYRDGRGYRFIHILFRDYVASLEAS